MKNKFIKLVFVAFALITQLSPLKAQTQEIDLSGKWGFQTDVMDFRRGSLDVRYIHRLQESIVLPAITDDYKIGYKSPYRHIDRLTRVYEYMGPAWYQREIAIPKEWKGKRIFVYFERTHWLSSIYVDTKEVSKIDYVSVPHNHELTDFVKPGKSFFMNHLVRQYWEQNTHIILIDIGNSYKGLCDLIHQRTNGEDGIYYTYSEKHPIAFNPFFTEDKVFDLEKKESIKTLIMSLWKRDTEVITRAEEVALSMAVNLFLEKIKEDNELVPSFNTFYEFVQGEFRGILEEKHYREKDFDLTNFLNVLAPYYRGGEYDYLLNSDEQLDLLNKRFVVFEIDEIKEHKILFPVVTVIIMEAFINKMRRLHGVRKMIVVEEAWKAIAREGMADYIKFLYKTVRKYFGEAVVVTQELDDIVSSPIIKDTIINNADCKILLDQRKYINKFDSVQSLLGLTDKEKGQILSINQSNDPARKYKEV